MAFADSFTLTRARIAGYRDASGVLQLADADAPRFDHSATGEPLGLLIEGRPETRLADRVAAKAAAWPADLPQGKATILHTFTTPAGELKRRAAYVRADHLTALDGLLKVKGWHREVSVIPGFLPNRGGFVRWRRVDWSLGALIAASPTSVVGVTPDIVLLES